MQEVDLVLNNLKEIDFIKNISNFDYIGTEIIEMKNGLKRYNDNCINGNYISESSLSRILSMMTNKEFAMLTAYRILDKHGNKLSIDNNIKRNRILRGYLNSKKLGVHQLVGHWRECTNPNKSYSDCDKIDLVDTIERSYLITKPDNMESDVFKELITQLMTIDGETQDAFILKNNNGIFAVYKNGNMDKIGTDYTVGKIAQAYSQYVKKLKVPFTFEGLEIPSNSLTARIMTENNVLYIDYPMLLK